MHRRLTSKPYRVLWSVVNTVSAQNNNFNVSSSKIPRPVRREIPNAL
jgi:hypothetical protein